MKETVNETKKQPTGLEEILANDIFDKGLVSTIYEELTKPNTQKIVKKWAQDMTRHFSKKIPTDG